MTAVVGASGSGKTTLLQMINGLEQPDAGCIEVMGQAVPKTNLEPFRRVLAMRFRVQDYFLT